MSFYHDVRDGTLKVSLLLTVPRTNSTALSRALAQSPDIDLLLLQPFDHVTDKGGADPVRFITREVEKLKREKASEVERPLHILVKEMAYDLTRQRMAYLAAHCENIGVLVRDPFQQAYSHIKVLKGLKGRGSVNKTTLKLQKMSFEDGASYISGAWSDLGKHRITIDRVQNQSLNIRILDGDLFRAFPQYSLQELCGAFNVEYSDDSVNNWGGMRPVEKALLSSYSDKYVGKSGSTKNLQGLTSKSPGYEAFHSSLRTHLQRNLSTYAQALFDPRALRPNLNDILNESVEGAATIRSFMDYAPLAAYTMMKGHNIADEQSLEGALADQYLRRVHPEHCYAFDIIDEEFEALHCS